MSKLKFTYYHSLHGSVHTERPHVKTETYLLRMGVYIQSVHMSKLKFTYYHSLHGSVHKERPHVKTETYLLPLTAWECTYRASTCQN